MSINISSCYISLLLAKRTANLIKIHYFGLMIFFFLLESNATCLNFDPNHRNLSLKSINFFNFGEHD